MSTFRKKSLNTDLLLLMLILARFGMDPPHLVPPLLGGPLLVGGPIGNQAPHLYPLPIHPKAIDVEGLYSRFHFYRGLRAEPDLFYACAADLETVELSLEDVNLIEVLWKQDIDLGVSRDAYDPRPPTPHQEEDDAFLKEEVTQDFPVSSFLPPTPPGGSDPDLPPTPPGGLTPIGSPFAGLNFTIDSETGEPRLFDEARDEIEEDLFLPSALDTDFLLSTDDDYLSQIEDLERVLFEPEGATAPDVDEMYPNECWTVHPNFFADSFAASGGASSVGCAVAESIAALDFSPDEDLFSLLQDTAAPHEKPIDDTSNLTLPSVPDYDNRLAAHSWPVEPLPFPTIKEEDCPEDRFAPQPDYHLMTRRTNLYPQQVEVDECTVLHNHTYHAPLPLPDDSNLYSSSSLATSEELAEERRDERRARELRLPLTVDEIVHLAIEEYNERLAKYELTDDQLGLIRDIRRRGKNKVAAQNCRKRKMDQIHHLQEDLDLLHREKSQLQSRQQELLQQKRVLRDTYSRLCRFLEVPEETTTLVQRSQRRRNSKK